MKIGDLLIGIIAGIFISISFYSCLSETKASCNHMEETRLKVALNECSDTILFYVWDFEGSAESNE